MFRRRACSGCLFAVLVLILNKSSIFRRSDLVVGDILYARHFARPIVTFFEDKLSLGRMASILLLYLWHWFIGFRHLVS